MPVRWYTTVVEALDPRAQGAWWAQVLGWRVLYDSDDEVVIIPPWAEELGPQLRFEQVPPGLVFVRVDHPKESKNRLHLDLAAHVSDDREAEIQRLLDLGARRTHVGEPPEATWDVFLDPEGNEFCLLSSREQ